MNAPKQKKRNQTTLRLTPELDNKISQQAEKIGISKNAFVQMALKMALKKPLTELLEDDDQAPTGTDG